jgi:O-antigen/teichoic acid export membrane protein
MSTQTSDNNKRIAKNTLLLYFRMLLMMAVSLFTSRVVLNTLGVEDFGIYSVVGGVVGMFVFINNSMSSATQRYITFALGKGDKNRLQTVFSTTLQIHSLIAVIIVLLGETVGLWFLYNKMQIPADRMDAALWVMQCSIVSMVVMIVSVPYNADVIAHEKMSAFAYISILEVVLKLAIVYLLLVFSYDKLILYAILILMIQILIRFCYSIYCNKHFEETRYKHVWDKKLFKEMTGFAGWNLFGNMAGVLFGQGLNMLLNFFFGPVVNAARAVAVQVQGAIQQFVGNFQTALNPQITKTYATGELNEMHRLMFRSARFSFYLLFFLSLPVLYETDFILTIWLKIVPENAVAFLRIMICTSLIYTIANPLIIANQATGRVMKYQAVCGTILLLILPISYLCLKMGCPAYSVFIVHFLIESVTQVARMILLRPLIGLRIRDYFIYIYKPVLIVVGVSVILPSIFYYSMNSGLLRVFTVFLMCVMSIAVTAYLLGLSVNERSFVKSKVMAIFHKIKNK